MPKSVPNPVHWDRELFEQAAKGVLVVQTCAACGHDQQYPKPACANCLSRDLTWKQHSGRGEIYSFTYARVPLNPAFKDEAPITLVDVQLDGGPRLLARLADPVDTPLAIGDRVIATPAPGSEGGAPAAMWFRLDR